MTVRRGQARACANVALVKYWGKRDPGLNLPVGGSISATMEGLTATATVRPWRGAPAPRFVVGGAAVGGPPSDRMAGFLGLLTDVFASAADLETEVEVDFPVAAGLASSAAIYCAVAAAAAAACDARLTREALTILARRGSGSAARSVFGGIVEWRRGERADGSDSTAHQILAESEWDLAVAVAIVSDARKAVGSREGMEHTARTSPLFGGWVAGQEDDLRAARRAVAMRDLAALGTVAEENCLRMHATAISARPPVLYWETTTLAVMRKVHEMRRQGIEAYFSIDAGPQVKVLCGGADLTRVATILEQVPGVLRVLCARLGPGVVVLEGPSPWT
jgi:diphosphomevalonate decarboxylase